MMFEEHHRWPEFVQTDPQSLWLQVFFFLADLKKYIYFFYVGVMSNQKDLISFKTFIVK